MSDRLGRVPVQEKMAAFDGEIGGDGKFFAGAGPEQGAIVPDAESNLRPGQKGGAAANPVEQGELAGGTRRGLDCPGTGQGCWRTAGPGGGIRFGFARLHSKCSISCWTADLDRGGGLMI